MRWLIRTATLIVVLILVLASGLYLRFGGGEPYADLSTPPQFPEGMIEAAVTFERPIGNAAVAEDGRIFFTVHPESKPDAPYLYEWSNSVAKPFPATGQETLFETPLGVAIDLQNRLWVIDPGNHGLGTPKLVAFDLKTGEVAYSHDFTSDTAPLGSFLQDLQVSPDGRFVFIADVGFWTMRPALVVLDTKTGTERRVLERHPSVMPQNLLIRNQIRDMRFLGGLLEMKTGIDGIALSRDGQWLAYAAMNHDRLYRLPTAILTDPGSTEEAIVAAIEDIGPKPLNDGLSIDNDGRIFITDIEHQGIMARDPDGTLRTVIRDSRIRWADGLSFGPDGWLYLADSAIPELVLQSVDHHKAVAPYTIWRFRPGSTAPAGQ